METSYAKKIIELFDCNLCVRKKNYMDAESRHFRRGFPSMTRIKDVRLSHSIDGEVSVAISSRAELTELKIHSASLLFE